LPNSIEIAGLEVIANTELSIKSTFWGIVIDLREIQDEKPLSSRRANSEFLSNEIDESDLQPT
jgi:hypothetical protein